MEENKKEKISYEIIKTIGVISDESPTGWTKEVNIINWNQHGNKIDIREWKENHKTMKKGITLYRSEVQRLKELLDQNLFDENLIKDIPKNVQNTNS